MMKDFYMKILGVGGGYYKSLLFSVIMGRRKINKFIKNETIRCLLQLMLYLSRFSYAMLYNVHCWHWNNVKIFLLRVEEIILFRCGDDEDSVFICVFFQGR